MKRVLKSFVAIATLAGIAFSAPNAESPLYAPAQLGFYSKTGIGWMYKESDDNLVMKAKGWDSKTENPLLRIYEDFGFGITDWLALRGAFGYTHNADIDRSGPNNARLGLNFRAVNSPTEAVVWDIYADAWLGGIAPMKATLVAAKKPQMQADGTPYVLTFDYDNYGNGRWGMWFGTSIGKSVDKFTMSVFGEAQVTFGNNNNEIKIAQSAEKIITSMVKQGVYAKAMDNMPAAIIGVCQQSNIPVAGCNKETLGEMFNAIEAGAKAYLEGEADKTTNAYVAGLPEKFDVDTKGTWDYAAGIRTLYEIDNNWALGGGFNWRHRATNTVEALNIKIGGTLDSETKDAITQSIADGLAGSMDDGTDEFTLTLLGSRRLTENLQLTLFGEYTFDTAEEKAQLGSKMKAEAGLRLSMQF